MLRKLHHVNNSLYEVEFAKEQIEHKEPHFVGFFILQYAKLRMFELYYNFFTRFCDVNKFEELKIDTDLLYFALAEEELEDCIRPELRVEWQRLRSKDFIDSFTADAVANFCPRTCCVKHKQHDKRQSLASSRKCSGVRRCYVCVLRHTVAMTSSLINMNLAVKVSTKVYWNRVATDY